MAVPSQITDHADQAKARLLEQFDADTAVKLRQLIDCWTAQSQELEDAIYPMLSLLDIDAQGDDQLDKIGELVNEPRAGASDANYRIAIRAKIQVIIGSGTPEDIIAVFQRVTGSTLNTIDFYEDFPAGFGVYGDAASYPDSTQQALGDAAPGGVYVAEMWRWTALGTSDLITTVGGDAIYLLAKSSGR